MDIFQQSTSVPSRRSRLGFTLVELLMVSAVMALLATTMAALATTVQVANEQQVGRGEALQHGQVAIERIERALQGATANEQFPGFIVVTKTINGATFPDTLVVWNPKGNPVDPTGLPRVNELVVFSPDDSDPKRLLEMRDTNDSSRVPPLASVDDWESLISMMKSMVYYDYDYGYGTSAAVLTDLMRTADVTNSSGRSLGKRGCIRFEQALRPSAAEWRSYKAGSTSWANLPWALGVYGATTGQRQSLCRIELQLRPADVDSNDKRIAIPFFGSSAIYYQLER